VVGRAIQDIENELKKHYSIIFKRHVQEEGDILGGNAMKIYE
jgi:hypothetical protein